MVTPTEQRTAAQAVRALASSAARPSGQQTGARGIPLGSPFGISVRVGGSTLVLLVLAGFLGGRAAALYVPRASSSLTAVCGVAFAALLFGSLLLHELVHCLVARGLGLPVVGIRFAGVGGLSQFGRQTTKAGHEAAIAAAGPFANVALAAGALLVAQACRADTAPWLVLRAVGFANLGLGVFNLLPGLPLDGGRVLMAAVWRARRDKVKGMRAAASAGVFIAALIAAFGVARTLQGDGLGLYTLLIAAVIYAGAKQARRGAAVTAVLPGLMSGTIARPTFVADSDLPLAEALVRAESGGSSAVVIGSPDGGVAAVMSGAAVDNVPAARRPWISLSEACRTATPDLVLPDDLCGDELIEALRSRPAGEYIVVDSTGHLVGVLATVDVLARVASAAR